MAKRSAKRRVSRADRVEQALPALSLLTDLPSFDELVPTKEQQEAFDGSCKRLEREEGVDRCELALGCVVRLDRGFPAVMTASGVTRSEFAAQLTKGDFSRVAVGDWVCLRMPEGHEMSLIQEILPRESDIARWKGGARGERQTLAANVDVVLVVQALGAEAISCERIARSAVVAADCGAHVCVVLTKADRAGAEVLGEDLGLIEQVLGSDARVAVTAAKGSSDEHGLEQAARAHGALWGNEGVRELVPHGTIAIMLGESGAGKSTLLNALLGRDALETGAVRERDDAGRHTTVARRMVSLPDAGVIVDEPGLRSLPMVGHERGLAQVFPEIADAARGCRFRDCTHTHEPGCEVLERFGSGSFTPVRLETYLALAHEMRESAATLDPDVVI
ncbi:MAG: ribosome small subunit-dependent GTPase A [Atopobiaceae bacterium]|nr:ribosome small subunit-dependent GTPase A [Atopobiaceae bacterium]